MERQCVTVITAALVGVDIAVNTFTKDFPKAHFNITLPSMPL
jgi:hypothetical protein